MAATNLEVWQKGMIRSIEAVSPNIRKFEIVQSNPAKAEPGAHIDLLVVSKGERLRRSYSVVGQSEDLKTITLAVLKTRDSRGGSESMHQLAVGQELDITQPIQNFPLRFGAENYLLLAGGVGITALVEMAQALKKVKADYRLIYVVKSRVLAAFAEELAASHGSRFELFVDDEENPLVVTNLISKQPKDTELYMCGPIRLMDEVRREWAAQALEITNLRYETFGASGWFESEEFKVRVEGELDVLVGKNQTMLEALEQAGFEVMADCRKGECGLCELRVEALSGTIDHRDVFYSQNQKLEGEKIACCVSRVVSDRTPAEISVKI